ncbi:alpha/beta hydrolase family protein [bacterium BMS3Bbin01]|nr:alpha/beta hydrolase family protein [bacterium BMS3Bbin01]
MIDTESGVRLEARWDEPDVATGVVVFCHPHPQAGGTMHVPLMHRVTQGLVERDFAVLRFNFRGVGASTGTWDRGEGEIDDVAAAVQDARQRYPDLPLGLAGWSFGALTSLGWQGRSGDDSPYAGIALPVGMFAEPKRLAPAPRVLIIGDRDQFATVEATRAYAKSIGARVEVLDGSDHFFTFRHERVTEIVAQTLAQRLER